MIEWLGVAGGGRDGEEKTEQVGLAKLLVFSHF